MATNNRKRGEMSGVRRRDELPLLVVIGRFAKLILILAAIAFGVGRFLPQKRDDEAMKAQVVEAERQCAELRAEAAREQRETERLRYDNGYLEVVARDRLNLHRPGEQIVRFKEVPEGE